ncbi:MAG: D-glycero-beta-D-manno-heptose 1-phosphate adenylyltransferase [Bacteroidales bacterium]
MEHLTLIHSKIVNPNNLEPLLTYWRFRNDKIVFTNGCFDLLHRGHIEYLAQAADLGKVLVVGINTDLSVKKLKGDDRPLQDEQSRKMILASLRFVTTVVPFEDDTPYELIKQIKPDVLVKGADYKEHEIVGADIVKQNKGQIVPVQLTEGYSTSGIIEKIRKS